MGMPTRRLENVFGLLLEKVGYKPSGRLHQEGHGDAEWRLLNPQDTKAKPFSLSSASGTGGANAKPTDHLRGLII